MEAGKMRIFRVLVLNRVGYELKRDCTFRFTTPSLDPVRLIGIKDFKQVPLR
jgi:hypothetical protein